MRPVSSLAFTRRGVLRATGLAAAAAAAGSGLPRGAAAATLDEIKKRGYMVVATEDDYRPFEFVKDGKPTGYDTELLNLMRKTAPFEIRQEIIPWTGLLPGVDTGKYDAAVTGALITKERQQFLDFTSPVSDATIYYVRRAKDDSIKSIKDLSGKTVGVQAGSAMLAALPQLEAMLQKEGGKLGKVVQYVSYPEAYQDLAIGRTDYVTNTVINLNLLLKEKPGVFVLGQPVAAKTYIAWAVKKGNASVLDMLNTFLANERKSGEMYKLQKEWLGQSFEDMPASFTAT
jgi:polar amino acid transport system substrate-binding protein